MFQIENGFVLVLFFSSSSSNFFLLLYHDRLKKKNVFFFLSSEHYTKRNQNQDTHAKKKCLNKIPEWFEREWGRTREEKKKYLVWTLMDCGFTILLVEIHRFSFVIVKKKKNRIFNYLLFLSFLCVKSRHSFACTEENLRLRLKDAYTQAIRMHNCVRRGTRYSGL